jgi:hypothetical protein
MTRIAEYLIISDATQELEKNDDRPVGEKLTFTLESGALTNFRAVLAFVLKVESGADDLHLEVEINGSDQVRHTFNGYHPSSTFHEVIAKDVLRANGENELRFELDGGEGKIKFADVVLFYRREV